VADKASSGSKYVGYLRNLMVDSFFMKVRVTNGVCFKGCAGDGVVGQRPRGTEYAGAVWQLTVLDVNGVKRVVSGSSTGAPFGQGLGYGLVGLGRTNNYVEEFSVGIRHGITSRSGLIPNAMVFVHPSSPVTLNARREGWSVEVYINPGVYVYYVSIALVVTCVLLVLVVWGFKYQERKEDERERRAGLHVLNFDAL
jgi:integrin alpha FG-GAP repeat containing protein 1